MNTSHTRRLDALEANASESDDGGQLEVAFCLRLLGQWTSQPLPVRSEDGPWVDARVDDDAPPRAHREDGVSLIEWEAKALKVPLAQWREHRPAIPSHSELGRLLAEIKRSERKGYTKADETKFFDQLLERMAT